MIAGRIRAQLGPRPRNLEPSVTRGVSRRRGDGGAGAPPQPPPCLAVGVRGQVPLRKPPVVSYSLGAFRFPPLLLPGPSRTRSGSEDAPAAGPKAIVSPRECPLTPPTSPYTVLLLSFHQSRPVRCLLRAQHLAGPPWSRPRLLSLVSTPGHLAPFCSSNTPSRGLLGATALAGPSGLGHWSRSKCHSSGRLSWSGTAILWDYGRRRGEVAGRTWECCSIATTQTELPVTRGTTPRGSTLPAPGGSDSHLGRPLPRLMGRECVRRVQSVRSNQTRV